VPITDPELLADAAAYINEWVDYRCWATRTPGVGIAIASDSGIVLSAAHGHADVAQNVRLRVDHAFRIASHSKTFTATAIMLLVQEGKLRLDDRLSDWISWLGESAGASGRATLRQVLSHSAGIIRDGLDCDFWSLEHGFPDRVELEELATTALSVLPVNQRFKYSNIGYGLLGLVIEAAAGMPYNRFVTDRIVDPLGLECTGPELDERAEVRLATGYTADRRGREREPLPHAPTGALSAATGFYATTEDLCRYASAHFLGAGSLLSDDSKREMQHPVWELEDKANHYGLGLHLSEVTGRSHIGHSGGFPGFATTTRIDPAERLVVVALTNCTDGPAEGLTAGMLTIIRRALQSGRRRAEESSKSRFTGRFEGTSQVRDIACFGDDLVAFLPEAIDPSEGLAELRVIGPDRLRIEAADGTDSPGEDVLYEFDSAGSAMAIRWAGNTMQRVAT
jgi:CubicO group peptidase (beta-lactamase class C family)